jgi:hypothetical protein
MGYLICKKCNGYYKLKEDESIVDFESCECGGKFTYDKSLDDINKNYGNSETIEEKELKENVNKPALATKKFPIRLVGIIIGVIIIFAVKILFYSTSSDFFYLLFYLLCIFGGLVTSLIAGGNYKEGAINGFIAGFIGGALSLLYLGYNQFYYGIYGLAGLIGYIIGVSIVPAILSLIGGLISIFMVKHFKK